MAGGVDVVASGQVEPVVGEEGVVEAVAVAAAAVPAVAGGVGMQGAVGVGEAGVGEGAVEVVFPAAEDRVVRDVAGFEHVEVARHDDGSVDVGEELGQRLGDGVLEGALVLVAACGRPAGRDVEADQAQPLSTDPQVDGGRAVGKDVDAGRHGFEGYVAGGDDRAVVGQARPQGVDVGVAVVGECVEQGVAAGPVADFGEHDEVGVGLLFEPGGLAAGPVGCGVLGVERDQPQLGGGHGSRRGRAREQGLLRVHAGGAVSSPKTSPAASRSCWS